MAPEQTTVTEAQIAQNKRFVAKHTKEPTQIPMKQGHWELYEKGWETNIGWIQEHYHLMNANERRSFFGHIGKIDSVSGDCFASHTVGKLLKETDVAPLLFVIARNTWPRADFRSGGIEEHLDHLWPGEEKWDRSWFRPAMPTGRDVNKPAPDETFILDGTSGGKRKASSAPTGMTSDAPATDTGSSSIGPPRAKKAKDDTETLLAMGDGGTWLDKMGDKAYLRDIAVDQLPMLRARANAYEGALDRFDSRVEHGEQKLTALNRELLQINLRMEHFVDYVKRHGEGFAAAAARDNISWAAFDKPMPVPEVGKGATTKEEEQDGETGADGEEPEEE